jgi:hypothetical protein
MIRIEITIDQPLGKEYGLTVEMKAPPATGRKKCRKELRFASRI